MIEKVGIQKLFGLCGREMVRESLTLFWFVTNLFMNSDQFSGWIL